MTARRGSATPHQLTRRHLMQGLVASTTAPWLMGCSGENPGSFDGSTLLESPTAVATPPTLTVSRIAHPGLLNTEADFERMAKMVRANEAPWVEGWGALASSPYSSAGAGPRPSEEIVRGGDGSNFGVMYGDMLRTYQLAVRWKVSGDKKYADRAVVFLNAWSSTMKRLSGNADRFLAAGIYGYQWACAAEIMRTYPGWESADVTAFQDLLYSVFYPMASQFLVDHNGTGTRMQSPDITNYWANWDLCCICAVFAIGVFCDKPALCNEAVGYFLSGRGNGAVAHVVYVLHPGYLGQWQESGRDQGHASLGISLIASLCEMAWNQGIDLYGYWNNRVLAGAEYVAASNLADANGNFPDLPYSTYRNKQGTSTMISGGGRPSMRAGWEILFNHYVNRKGLSAPYMAAMVAKIRPEGLDRRGDEPSFGTLTHAQSPYSGAVTPSGLTAVLHAGKVQLSWWGVHDATSYSVKRGTSANGPFSTIASVTEPRTYTDAAADGIWHYAVSAITPHGETDVSNAARIALPFEPRLFLALNEGSGTTAQDTSPARQHGTFKGGAAWGDGRVSGKALQLDGTDGHLELAEGIVTDVSDFTVGVWINWDGGSGNLRIFDFGSSDIAYAALILNASGNIRFATTGTRYWGEQSIQAPARIAPNTWVHVAVTLFGIVGTLYVDGFAMATNNDIDFAPFQMGKTTQNWLGRSQYAVDPFFKGRMQDLRVYRGALTSRQIAVLAAA